MGIPHSVPSSGMSFLMPDAVSATYHGYDILNGTWKWGLHSEGERVYAVLIDPEMYRVVSPEDFDYEFPPLPTPTLTIPEPTVEPTPDFWLSLEERMEMRAKRLRGY